MKCQVVACKMCKFISTSIKLQWLDILSTLISFNWKLNTDQNFDDCFIGKNYYVQA